MTKDEALQSTGRAENELINLALQFAIANVVEWRNHAFNKEGFKFYDNLLNAFCAILHERENRKGDEK